MPHEEPAISHERPIVSGQEPVVPEPAAQAPQPAPHEPPAYEPVGEGEEWLEETEELPRRPRRRLLSPLPLSLLGLLLIACGFIGGVLVEKSQSSSGSSAGSAAGVASRFRGLASATSNTGTSSTSTSGAPSGGFTRPTAGTVAYLSGSTLYVTDSEGNTIKVTTSAGTTVSKTVKASVKGIHPGETVTITGATAANGSVGAESISVGSGGGLAALFGGSSSATGTSGSGKQALFGGGG